MVLCKCIEFMRNLVPRKLVADQNKTAKITYYLTSFCGTGGRFIALIDKRTHICTLNKKGGVFSAALPGG